MLEEGEFDKTVTRNGIEVWVTQMGDYMNMNTAFIDRGNGVVAIIDPFDSVRWAEELAREGLKPTHLLYTHTHRDHVVGYSSMIKLNPEVEVWGHEDARVPKLVNHVVFERVAAQFKRPKSRELTRVVGHELIDRSFEWIAGRGKLVRRRTTQPASTCLCMPIGTRNLDPVEVGEDGDVLSHLSQWFERRTQCEIGARVHRIPRRLHNPIRDVEECGAFG